MSDVSNVEARKTRSKIAGFIFVACILICTGIGMIFDRPDVGGVLGVGIGFLLLGIFKYYVRVIKERTVTIKPILGSALAVVSGIGFIVAGVALLLNYEILIRYIGAIWSIAIGLLLVLLGIHLAK